jgi:ABC-type multidrug transport system ATPase subunit
VNGIECHELHKAYRATRALDGVSFQAEPGKILALLGANGSGKTTSVRVLSTQCAPDSGSARVAGKDVVRDASAVREAIGLTAQETHIDAFITAEEHLTMVARLRRLSRRQRCDEVDALLRTFDLEHVAHDRAGRYSGGMRRRLDIAASFIGKPAVLFLDEPANGLDPQSRLRLWDAIRACTTEGATVLLTTQYMEEADVLADAIVVLASGKVIARGTPGELKDRIRGRVVELTLARPDHLEATAAILADLGVSAKAGDAPSIIQLVLLESNPSLRTVLNRLDTDQTAVTDIIVRRPTLDEAFLHLTGTTHRSDDPDFAGVPS